MIEKHITLDKGLKGTDHVCSLTPAEFAQLVRDVRVIEASLGTPIKRVVTSGESLGCLLSEELVASLYTLINDPLV